MGGARGVPGVPEDTPRLLPTLSGMKPIAVVTTIPAPGTKPASIADCLRVGAANMLEITGSAAAGNKLYLLRWHPDIGANGEWRPWKSDRPFTPDAHSYFSGCIELPEAAGSEYFLMFSESTAEGAVTDCFAQAQNYR